MAVTLITSNNCSTKQLLILKKKNNEKITCLGIFCLCRTPAPKTKVSRGNTVLFTKSNIKLILKCHIMFVGTHVHTKDSSLTKGEFPNSNSKQKLNIQPCVFFGIKFLLNRH